MEKGEEENIDRATYEIKKEAALLRAVLMDAVNKGIPDENLTTAIKNFQKKRLPFNKLNLGMLIYFKIVLIPFKLTGDPEKDIGQKNPDINPPD